MLQVTGDPEYVCKTHEVAATAAELGKTVVGVEVESRMSAGYVDMRPVTKH